MPCLKGKSNPLAAGSGNEQAVKREKKREKQQKKDEKVIKKQQVELAQKKEVKEKQKEKKTKELQYKQSEKARKQADEKKTKTFNAAKKVGQAKMKKDLIVYAKTCEYKKKKAKFLADMAAVVARDYEKFPKLIYKNKEKMAKAQAWLSDFEKTFYKNERKEKRVSHKSEVSAKQLQREKMAKWDVVKGEKKKNELAHKTFVKLTNETVHNATQNRSKVIQK